MRRLCSVLSSLHFCPYSRQGNQLKFLLFFLRVFVCLQVRLLQMYVKCISREPSYVALLANVLKYLYKISQFHSKKSAKQSLREKSTSQSVPLSAGVNNSPVDFYEDFFRGVQVQCSEVFLKDISITSS